MNKPQKLKNQPTTVRAFDFRTFSDAVIAIPYAAAFYRVSYWNINRDHDLIINEIEMFEPCKTFR